MSTRINRVIAAAAAASIAFTGLSLTTASAAPFYGPQGVQASPLLTDVGYRHRGDGAAVLGAFAAIAGTIATIAATQHHRDHYYDGGPYGYAPAPYAYAPGYGGGWNGWHGHRHWR
jgi:hypothetical protein